MGFAALQPSCGLGLRLRRTKFMHNSGVSGRGIERSDVQLFENRTIRKKSGLGRQLRN
jgi:hypothetical protein